jgi:hypothetical protein
MPTPPQCVCSLSDKVPLKDKPGWFEYTFRCRWQHGEAGPAYLDTNTYTVSVDWKNDDAGATALAKDKCPYEPKPRPRIGATARARAVRRHPSARARKSA